MIRVAIIEDEPSCVQNLRNQLQRFEEENQTVFQITVFRSALELVGNYQPVYDILFMDIEMPLMDGISAARQIRTMDEQVLIMFITHAAKYAVRSYEVQAIDYILKPLSYPAFALKMKKVLRHLRNRRDDFVLLQGQGAVFRILMENIFYVEVIGHQLLYHTAEGDFSVRGSLKNAAAALDHERFVRCNHCFLINLDYLQEIKDDDVVVQGHVLKVSRSRRKELLEALFRYQRRDTPSNR